MTTTRKPIFAAAADLTVGSRSTGTAAVGMLGQDIRNRPHNVSLYTSDADLTRDGSPATPDTERLAEGRIDMATTLAPELTVAPTAAPKKTRIAPIPRVLRAQAETILAGTYAYMDSPPFHEPGTEATLFADAEPSLPMVAWYQPTRDDIAGQSPAGSPQLMKADEEKLMFLRYNFAKVRLTQIQEQVATTGLTKDLAQQAVEWHHKMEHFREYLTRTNLALVLAMAKRTRLGDIDFAEIVSEGNMALLRAVDKFNVDRGFKFSTYACRAILKAFSRTAQKHNRHRMRFPVEFEPEQEKSDWSDKKRDAVQDDIVDELKQVVDRNLAQLSNIEQTVIKQRFNWDQDQDSPLTLEQVGRIIGVTKERVRQIQNKALIKIRRIIEDGVLKPRDLPATALEA